MLIDLGSGLKFFGVLRSLGGWGWSKFARQPQGRAFVTWQTYYRAYLGSEPGHALIQHTGPWVGDAARQTDLINGMASGRPAAIVCAPPGCGKSRFALELARRIEKSRDHGQVLFVHHDETAVREELNQLSQLKHLVLIVDDAHECPELIQLLASHSTQSSSTRQVNLVCVTRTAGRAEVSRALNHGFAPGVIQDVDLGRPTTQLVRSLIDKLLPKSSPMHRDTIERFVRQSYFGAVFICTLLGRERKLPQSFQRQDLRDRICRQPLADAAKGVCPIETAFRALAIYAALSPVPRANGPVRELAAQLSGLTPERVDVLLDRVLAAGLFQEYGRVGVRPIPDLLGDLILEDACLDAQGRPTPYSTQLLERVFELDPVAAAANCGEIGQLFGTAQDADLVSKLILERARVIPGEHKRDLMRLLQSCQPLTARRPLTVLEVVRMLESRGILRRSPPPGELHRNDSIEMYTCALLMSAGEADPTAIPVALQLARDLYLAGRGDEQSRQRVRDQLAGYCKFEVGRSVAHARAVVESLRAWISDSDVQVAALAASLSGQFLLLDIEGQHHQSDSVSFYRALNPDAEVWGVRDVAVDTLVRSMAHADASVHYAALGAFERYAHHELAAEQLALDSWRPQLAREIGLMSGAMIKLVKSSSSLPVWARAELQGWLWWVGELDVLHKAGVTVLEAIPDSDAYRLWKSLHAQRLPVRIVLPADLSGRAAARHDYFKGLSVAREESAADQARELFEALDPRYSDADAWRKLWLTALEQSPPTPVHVRADSVVQEFARRRPEVAWLFVTESDARGPLFAILPMLLAELRKQDRTRASIAARDVPPGTQLEDAWLRVLWAALDLDDAECTLLARGLKSADAEIRRRAAGVLLHSTGTDWVGAFRHVFAAIAQHPTDERLWALVIEQFVNRADGVLPPQLAGPTQAMVQVADELITLFQTYGPRLRWGYQQHTRQLSRAFAILAIVHPQRLQDWMRQAWGQPARAGTQWNDESPLSITRLAEITRPIRESPDISSYWIDAFAQWILRERELGRVGALGLTQLCSLDHARVGELVEQIGSQPTDSAVRSFTELIQHQKSDRGFATKALAMLEVWTRFPNSYRPIEDAVIHGMVQGAGGRSPGQPSPAHVRALDAIQARTTEGTASGLLLATLERAEREIRVAMANDVARDEETAER